MKVSCVILASGNSTRFGDNKLFAKVENKSLIYRTLETIPALLKPFTVVVTQYSEVLYLCKKFNINCVINPMNSNYICDSIRIGITSIDKDSDGCMFRVCDQPFLTEESIINLMNFFCLNSHNIVALSFNGKRGNPVIFPRKYFLDLASLKSNNGGKEIINRHISSLKLVSATNKDELIDVDYFEDILQNN